MAYYIFLKILRSLEEFRKIPISKFLLNLHLQISKALEHSKIQFLFRNEFSFNFRPNRPSGPLGLLPPSSCRPSNASSSSHVAAPWMPANPSPVPWSPNNRPPVILPPPLQSTIVTTPFTLDNGSHEGAYLPPPPAIPGRPPWPLQKGRAPSSSNAPPFTLFLFFSCPSTTHTKRHHRRFFAAVTQSPHCRPHLGEARDGLPTRSFLHCSITGEPPGIGAAVRPSFDEPLPPATMESMVEPWTSHPSAGP
jgi:hypothetical protein